MLIKNFSCNRFAGLKEVNVEFKKGLNVVLGPNESGKSTLIEGIFATLFKEPKLRMSVKKDIEFSRRFMPHPTGDVIDGEITICIKDKEYHVKKEWGTEESFQLTTPDGNIIKNIKTAERMLNEILKFGQGTYSSIIFAKQRDIKAALDKILSEETSNEVSNILMKAMMELDGISVDALGQKIEMERDSLLKRWDLEKNYPINNRGINNPYKTGLGKVLENYYQKERIRLYMDEARSTEEDFEVICDELKVKVKQLQDLRSRKEELEKIEDDVTKRMILEPKITSLEKEVSILNKVFNNWPMVKAKLQLHNGELEAIFPKIEALKQEKENLRKIKRKLEITKKLKQVDDLNKSISNTRTKINEMKSISNTDIESLEGLHDELTKTKAAMEAGVIIGQFSRIAPTCKILLTTDFKSKQLIKKTESFTAKGYVKLETDEFELELKAGELDYENLKKAYEDNQLKLENLLKSLEVESISEAKLKREALKELKNELKSMTRQVMLLLGDESYEDLKAELEQFSDLGEVRPLEKINEELEELSNRQMECVLEKKALEKTLADWIDEYGDQNKVSELLIQGKMKLKKIAKELAGLAPIPSEFESAKDFKKGLARIRKSYERGQQEYSKLRENYYEHQKNLPESTYEELKAAYEEAELEFNKTLKRAKKFVKIQEAFVKTKDEIGKAPFRPLAEKFTEYLDMLTDGNYHQGRIDKEFNISLQNKDGVVMPHTLLSSGTHDCVALALRFSILKYIYGDSSGYVILDDCIVDLDPIRQKTAIRLIKQYAEKNQVIFTTCNPEIAKSLGGNIITL